MKLPENYENWIEFAKKCDEILQKYPDAKIIKYLNEDIDKEFVTEYNINTVKAKAFDEVMEKTDFSIDTLIYLRDKVLEHQDPIDKLNNVIEILTNLAHDR